MKEFNEIINNRKKKNENSKVNNGKKNELINFVEKQKFDSGLSPINEMLVV